MNLSIAFHFLILVIEIQSRSNIIFDNISYFLFDLYKIEIRKLEFSQNLKYKHIAFSKNENNFIDIDKNPADNLH